MINNYIKTNPSLTLTAINLIDQTNVGVPCILRLNAASSVLALLDGR